MYTCISRRSFLCCLPSSAFTPSIAAAEIACSPLQMNGIQLCEVGVVLDVRKVGVNTPSQEHQNWCWAACIQAIFGLNGHDVSQSEIVERLFGSEADLPANGNQVAEAINGGWTDAKGDTFTASADVLWNSDNFFGQADAAMQAATDLQNNRPLINGALGHATVLIALSFYKDVYGNPILASLTVSDPWPGSPKKRTLTAIEAANTRFLTKLSVY